MTTTTLLKKTPVETKWNLETLQERVSRMMATQMMTTMGIICKQGEEVGKEFRHAMNQNKINFYKELNVKTPLELITAMAEMEHNVFGSKIEIWGEENNATMQYNSCGMWEAMQKHGNLNEQQKENMGKGHEECLSSLAEGFGFKAEIKHENNICTVNFSK